MNSGYFVRFHGSGVVSGLLSASGGTDSPVLLLSDVLVSFS
jgi:hypothetical protein